MLLSSDERSFRDLIVWLEDQKVRHYKIEDRAALKAVDSNDWPTAYKRYLGGLNCSVNPTDRPAVIDWLLGIAVRFEYGDNGKPKSEYQLILHYDVRLIFISTVQYTVAVPYIKLSKSQNP